MKKNIFQKEAKKAFLIELKEMEAFVKSKHFDVEELCKKIYDCKGKIFLTGVGKSGHIANKISATLSSTGTPSFFIHPAEALHGDLGMVEKSDAILAISKSGESKEICDLIPAIKLRKIPLYSITENEESTIASSSETHILVKVAREACPNDLAPTSSTTVTLALGDAIAISLLKAKGFTSEDFAKSHPGGKLGKKLTLKVKDIMIPISKAAIVTETDTLKDLIYEVSSKQQGIALIKKSKKIIGVFSDGDLRRQLQKNADIHTTVVKSVMKKKFKTISNEELISEAAKRMKRYKVYNLVVEDGDNIVGILTMHDILEADVL
ncbi:MAG: D-arabinose 5-phosphate isomerase [Gammaproteobacteria bacterium]|nr:D-arabinose 5-phosphate isomerase [Gammaproteobacteria bacterium]|tara:strand:+ start:1 stop:966 length:966 start_codon:yes stop_codon:yes gene_type:complete